MSKEGSVNRGEKWSKVLEEAEFKGDVKSVKWLKSEKSVVEDMEEYKKDLKVKEEAKKNNSKGKK